MSQLNYRHLHYFWVVAQEGGFARAAQRLDMAVQTVSAQVRELERALGVELLKPAGRGVTLTEAGKAAYAQAEAIFQIGQALPEAVQAAAQGESGIGRVRLAVGLCDGLSKLAAHDLLAPLLNTPGLRLLCHEGEFEPLMTELALHQLDVVLAGQAAPPQPNLRLSSRLLATAPVRWFGPKALVTRAAQAEFPACLARLPVLLPTGHSPLRSPIERWLEGCNLRPQLAGEFEDSALMAVFAARGLGVFPLGGAGASDLQLLPGLRHLGDMPTAEAREEVHAVYTRRGREHPLVKRLLEAAG